MHLHPHAPNADTPSIEGPIEWSTQERAEIEAIVARYPTRRAAMLPVLWKAQHKWGWLNFDVMRCVAEVLEQPPSEVYSVASFYTMLKKQPTGAHLIQVCHTLPCAMRGAERIIDFIKAKLGIREGETVDYKGTTFTLMRVECLASCGSAPMFQLNEHFFELLTEERVDEIIEGICAGQPIDTPTPEVDNWQWTIES